MSAAQPPAKHTDHVPEHTEVMAELSEDELVAMTSGGRRLLRRFLSNKLAVAAGAFMLALVAVAILAPWLAPSDPNQSRLSAIAADGSRINLVLRGPDRAHWLGTDELGRDQLSRLIFGARTSLLGALIAVSIGFFVGTPLGVIAGYFGRWIDAALSRVSDALQSVPGLVLALTVVAALGPGLVNGMIAIGIVSIPRFFRISRAATQDIRGETFIEASRALGCSQGWTMWRHIVPNVMSPMAVQMSLGLGASITAEASLSFIGLGVKAPTASWGSMLGSAASNITRGTHLVIVPGLMIASTVLALTFLGDGLREALGTRRIVGE